MKIVSDSEFRKLEKQLSAKIMFEHVYYGDVAVPCAVQNISQSIIDKTEYSKTTCPALIVKALEEARRYHDYKNRPKKSWVCRLFGC